MKTTRAFTVALIAIAALVIGLLGAMFGVLPPMVGFGLFFVGGVLGLVAIVWGIVSKRGKTTRGGALAALIGLVPLLIVAVPAAIMSTKSGPGINDITTDSADPPMFLKATEHGEYAKDFIEPAQKTYPKVKTLRLSLSKDEALKLVADVAAGTDGWVIASSTANGIEGYQLTRLFRFRDDFVVRVRQAGDSSIVDMRSASRDGKADFGVNAARIESFFATLTSQAGK